MFFYIIYCNNSSSSYSINNDHLIVVRLCILLSQLFISMFTMKKILLMTILVTCILPLVGCTTNAPETKVNTNGVENEQEATNDTEGEVDDDMTADVVINVTGENFAYSLEQIEVNEWDTVTINFESVGWNHDWVVDEFDAATEIVRPGTPTSVTFVADKAWEYEYYCSVGNHRAQGMVWTLVVLWVGETDNGEKEVLGTSPRHQEWVTVNNDGKDIYSWVVYPEVDTPAPVVIVIHENKWLNDWARQMADDIAAQGYIAVAPDLLSSFSDEKTRTSDFETPDDATQALYTLEPDDIMSDLQAVYDYANTLEAANGNIASAWFCRGWSQSFRYATANSELDKSFVFYGTAPEEEEVYTNIEVPVIAFYGGDDARVNATIEQTETYMTENNNAFSYEIYEWAGHAFMRSALSENAEQANIDAREQAFARMLEELKELN